MHEPLEYLREALVASAQAAEAVQPGERPLDDPAALAKVRAVAAPATRDQRPHAPAPELAAVLVVVITAVGEQLVGALSGAAALAAQRPEPVHEREQLGDVVAMAAGQRRGQRDPRRVGQQVVL